jgi:hypothetical protein
MASDHPRRRFWLHLLAAAVASTGIPPSALAQDSAQSGKFDVVVYGGTSSGVMAAVQARRMGKTVALVEPSERLGGMTSGGLGQTDVGHADKVGGLARDFFCRVASHYAQPTSWKQETQDQYYARSGHQSHPGSDVMWNFEPSVALSIFERLADEHGVQVIYGESLDREHGVKMRDDRIESIAMESGRVFSGKMYIDATYEGDLMAAAGVTYTIGRESQDQYGETFNGVRLGRKQHQLHEPIASFQIEGDPSSGLLAGVDPTGPGTDGQGDQRLQAYCFRLTLTDDPQNCCAIERPTDYDERQFEILFRNFAAGESGLPWICSPMPNRKTDVNNRTGFSLDFIGQNYDYPDANYARRKQIVDAHLVYTQGLLWTLANHPRVPEHVRNEVGRWGLCRDEFVATDGWSPQIYVREARRMISDYVMTQHDCEQRRAVEDSVGMGSYMMDSHNVRRYVDADGQLQNEGDVEEWQQMDAYPISYRSIVPRAGECKNLFVPVCLSASHIAFGSIRMEPVYMILGQSAATAASLAIDDGDAVQDVDYRKLQRRLLADGQVLQRDSPSTH